MANPNTARYCTIVESRWIAMVILMCDDTLSVLFKDGACCHYPNSSAAMYYSMLAAPSKGHWLWQHVYRILPYRRIALPCPAAGCGVATNCCPGTLPNRLHATVTQGGGTVVLTWDGSAYWSTLGIALSCGDTLGLRFRCSPSGSTCSDFTLEGTCDGGSVWWPFAQAVTGCSCDPLSVPFIGAVLDGFLGCTHCNGQTVSVTVTT